MPPLNLKSIWTRAQPVVEFQVWSFQMPEPIRNPVTGEEHRATIGLPHGFEYTIAEMGSASSQITGDMPLQFTDSYAQFNELHMTDRGVVR